MFIKDKEEQVTQVDFILQKTDTVLLRTQVNLRKSLDAKIKYFITHKESIIDSGEVAISDTAMQNLYYLPIPLNQHKRGWYEIELILLDDKQTTTFHYGFKTKNYWTDEIDEVVGVMRYILPYSEYKK